MEPGQRADADDGHINSEDPASEPEHAADTQPPGPAMTIPPSSGVSRLEDGSIPPEEASTPGEDGTAAPESARDIALTQPGIGDSLGELGAALPQADSADGTGTLDETPRTADRALECPFPGFRAFDAAAGERFGGRTQELDQLSARLRRGQVVALLGPSGTGKSSFIRAALAPALEAAAVDQSLPPRVVVVESGASPHEDPLAVVKDALLHATKDSGKRLRRRVKRALAAQVGALYDACAELASEGPLVLILDGLVASEELLAGRYLDELTELVTALQVREQQLRNREPTQGRAEERADRDTQPAPGVLPEASPSQEAVREGNPIGLMLVLEGPQVAQALAERAPSLAESLRLAEYEWPELSGDRLKHALRVPVEAVGWRIDDDLVDQISAALKTLSYPLARLQHVMRRMWKEADPEDRRLTLAEYWSVGGVEGSLEQHADELVDGAENEEERRVTREAFKRLVGLVDRRLHSTPVTLAQLAMAVGVGPRGQLLGAVLQRFRSAQILAPFGESELDLDTEIGLAHPLILEAWGTLHSWAEEESEDAALLCRLVERARRRERDETAEGLLRGAQLQAVDEWWGRRRPNAPWASRYLDPEEFAAAELYFRKSGAAFQREQELDQKHWAALRRERQQARARDEVQRRTISRSKVALIAVSVAALSAATAAWVGWQQRDAARLEAQRQAVAREDALRASEQQQQVRQRLSQSLAKMSDARAQLEATNQSLATKNQVLESNLQQLTEKNQSLIERDRLLTYAHDQALVRAQRAQTLKQQAQAQVAAVQSRLQEQSSQVQAAQQKAAVALTAQAQAISAAAALRMQLGAVDDVRRQRDACQAQLLQANRQLSGCETRRGTAQRE